MTMESSKAKNLQKAQQLIDQGKVSAAISIYRKIVDDDSTDLGAISMLSDLYVKAGRVPEAAEHFLRIAENFLLNGSAISAAYILKKILKLDPTNARAHMNLGKLHLDEGKTELAHTHFIEAGAAFWHKADTAAAIKMNERALAIKPDSKLAKAALALIQQEIDQPEPQQQVETIDVELEPIMISVPDEVETTGAAEKVSDNEVHLESTPDPIEPAPQPDPLKGLDEDAIVEQFSTAELLVGYGQVDEAIALLRDALCHSPDHIQIRTKLKDIYLRSEMIDRASEECVNIAGIYAARGETSHAREYILRARLLTHSVDPAEALAILQQNGVGEQEEIQDSNLKWGLNATERASVM